jgi:hypothetical protein
MHDCDPSGPTGDALLCRFRGDRKGVTDVHDDWDCTTVDDRCQYR